MRAQLTVIDNSQTHETLTSNVAIDVLSVASCSKPIADIPPSWATCTMDKSSSSGEGLIPEAPHAKVVTLQAVCGRQFLTNADTGERVPLSPDRSWELAFALDGDAYVHNEDVDPQWASAMFRWYCHIAASGNVRTHDTTTKATCDAPSD